jgi:signal transduction histidine kinase/FixJ family two-component response regulator
VRDAQFERTRLIGTLRMYRQYGNQVYKTVVVVWLTLSVTGVILAAATWLDLSRKLEEGMRSVNIHNELEGILRDLLEVEASQRGFTISGEERFLAPMRQAESSLPPRFERLGEYVVGDAAMVKQVMALRAGAELALNFHRQVVATRQAQGGEAAGTLVSKGEGERLMGEARGRVNDVRRLREDLISDNAAASARDRLLRASLTSLIAGCLGIGAGGFAFFLSRVMLGQQQREKELIEAKLNAERRSQEKTVFLANMSHEIRTPMNAILGFSELLGTELRDPRHRQFLQSIRSSATSLLQMINDILDMSKIEAGVMDLRLEPTDPREICDFLHTVFSEPAAKKNVRLECHITEDLPRALLLDRIRLRQVLVNLVGNAVKFTDRGNIDVRIQGQKNESSSHVTLLIEVQDTGVGIPQDKLEAIFKPFVQAGAHREKEKSGTGLGLSIVKRLTEMMGGTVVAASIPGQGSAFSLRFPDVSVSARLSARGKPDAERLVDLNQLKAATLLVVDDNETNCQLVSGMFAGSHHKLVFGSNGREAVEKAQEIRPDAILLDIRMPGMDGREALAEIRKLSGLEITPVIAVTASSLLREERDLRTRFSGFVRKPFSKRELFDELAQFLPRLAPGDSQASAAGEELLQVDPALAKELHRLLEEEWPGLHDSMAINETHAFADKLLGLARRWPCPPLESYAQTLALHAENYSIVDLEAHLFEFSALVRRLQPSESA